MPYIIGVTCHGSRSCTLFDSNFEVQTETISRALLIFCMSKCDNERLRYDSVAEYKQVGVPSPLTRTVLATPYRTSVTLDLC